MLYSPSGEASKVQDMRDRTEGEAMTGDEVRQVFEAMLPQETIDRLCQEFGVIERQRKLNLGILVRAMVISAGTPGRSQWIWRDRSVACRIGTSSTPRRSRCVTRCARRFPGPGTMRPLRCIK